MKVTILGTGIVGRTVAAGLGNLGHEVTIGTRNVESTLASEQQDAYGNPPFKVWYADHQNIKLKAFKEAAAQADLLFNCTSGQASVAVLESIGDEILNGKVLVDVANPLDFSQGMPPSLSPVNTDSLGEQIQARFANLKVVKSLNTMNTFLMVNPSMVQGDHNVFVCGNDEDAKNSVKEVLKSLGWRENLIIDLGDITNSRGTEMLLPIWLRLWGALGTAEFNFHIQTN
ncbi:NADPH-dependent F420 reductase [Muriicola sp. Z0-33]|uniref:NADPH-dependent F420 reductase n=1 Tax=Muriicola sp. Z0-33 TaxID=2816957 RepID=UPI0022370DEA|nr:NAD(P)-binding domain-containing protein [Muriicola sp. Z0-33]MCW5518154.1 NAD(P)-binding domain-containing protein [Muriicola sp. Z0-33]